MHQVPDDSPKIRYKTDVNLPLVKESVSESSYVTGILGGSFVGPALFAGLLGTGF